MADQDAMDQLIETPIQWSDAFNTDVPAIDDQHKKLFFIAESLRKKIQTGADINAVRTVVQWLVQYCFVHFHAEEKVQEVIKYPGIAGHKQTHAMFLEECRVLMESVTACRDDGLDFPAKDVFKTVVDWLVGHVCGDDAKIGAWVKQQGIDIKSIPELHDMTDALPDDLPDLTPTVG
jgi:hemerythrin